VGRKRFFSRSLALGFITALAIPVAAQAADREIYAVDDQNNLIRFDKKSPEEIDRSMAVTGQPAGVTFVGIDFQPATGDLYGAGTDSRIYRISVNSGFALPVDGPFEPALNGTSFGFDFNPVPNRIRIVSDADQNLRCNQNNGTCVQDGNLNRGTENPNIVGSAYTNSAFSTTAPAGTQLFAIDSETDTLYEQAPPNEGTLINPVPVDLNVKPRTGFDIAGAANGGLVSTVKGGKSRLYKVNIGTGNAKKMGTIGSQGDDPTPIVLGLAADQ